MFRKLVFFILIILLLQVNVSLSAAQPGSVLSLEKIMLFDPETGERHFYRMSIEGGHRVRITDMEGRNDVTLSPGGHTLAVRYSYYNKPWELAVYPVESHSFTETSNWVDEYRRILKLFEDNLNKLSP